MAAWLRHITPSPCSTRAGNLPLKGTVHDFQWTNPHAFIDVDVPNATGSTDLWKVELNSPNNLKRQGWKSTQMKPGDKITVVINPLRDGSMGGLFVAVTLADGKVMGDPTRAGGGPINVPQTNPPPTRPQRTSAVGFRSHAASPAHL